jgi:tRNA uridine 5-carboxymethylaminomethyl modification enzyme
MFTSRAEYRLRLRADNADQRLTDYGLDLGCIDAARTAVWGDKKAALARGRALAQGLKATPNELKPHGLHVVKDGVRRSAFDLLAYPNIGWAEVLRVWPQLQEIGEPVREQIGIDALYAGYMGRHEADIEAFRKDEALKIPENFDYTQIGSLSNEVRQKLGHVRPATLGAASRIPGVTPAALTALLRFVKKTGRKAA